MTSSKYKFSYTPQYSDLLYISFFLGGGGMIALWHNPLFIPLLLLVIALCVYFFIQQKPKIYFFEDFIEIRKGINKATSITTINYADVQAVEYIFSDMGRGNLFKISYVQSSHKHTLRYTFIGNPTQYEISFFKEKEIKIIISPESAIYKIKEIR